MPAFLLLDAPDPMDAHADAGDQSADSLLSMPMPVEEAVKHCGGYVRTCAFTGFVEPFVRVPELLPDGNVVYCRLTVPASAKGYGEEGLKNAELYLQVAMPLVAAHLVGMQARMELGRAVLHRGAFASG